MISALNSTASAGNPDRRKLPGESYGDRWLRLYADDMKIYARCDLEDLSEIYDALKNAADAACSVYNRPCVDTDGPSGGFLNDIGEKLDERRAALIEHVRRRPLTTEKEWDACCKILMRYEADCGAEFEQFSLIIEQMRGKHPALVGRA
ncbi:hypothetical protein [Mesorhizobium sp. M8A.F.Ca.ET.165.01.1.1]|uniref:hypothetical protein n=1 Tax=Mesorhizobium sp. M8A.F.Ca.ET.165.01.1.1 TaxID=2563960 RepID=UPI001093E9FE|nr:hypothetical protein [Mesorhizobium sp. M8A.F.Ca.ET.165.01.1.1]TGT36192.1 hypothetical protein EN808_29855 [Mesorhizobium sp. M8A.F.Ca.ET.165.01.1.1]